MRESVRVFILGFFLGFVTTFFAFCLMVISNTDLRPVPMMVVRSDWSSDMQRARKDDINVTSSLRNSLITAIHLNSNKMSSTIPINFNYTVASKLKEKVKVLVWVMTSPSTLLTKAKVVRDTWGKRCNKMIFFSSQDAPDFPAIGLNVSEGRQHLTAKTMKAFTYIYQYYMDEADWFMKVDDDTYVIVENLRYFLSEKNSSEPVYFGQLFKPHVKQGFYSGGAGYVLSKEALRRFGVNASKMCIQDGHSEDVNFGLCMEKLRVKTMSTLDALRRSRFHCFPPETHLLGNYSSWYTSYVPNGAKKGADNISDYPISFHYITPEMMSVLDFYVYHLRPYGIVPIL